MFLAPRITLISQQHANLIRKQVSKFGTVLGKLKETREGNASP